MGGDASEILEVHEGALGQTGGAELHQLSMEESPQGELEVVLMEGSGWPKACNSCTGTSISSQTISNGGGDQPHNNMQPYMALNYMMKVRANVDVLAELETEIQTLSTTVDSVVALISIVQQPIFSINFPDGFKVSSAVHINLEPGSYVVPTGYNLYVSEFEALPDHVGGLNTGHFM